MRVEKISDKCLSRTYKGKPVVDLQSQIGELVKPDHQIYLLHIMVYSAMSIIKVFVEMCI